MYIIFTAIIAILICQRAMEVKRINDLMFLAIFMWMLVLSYNDMITIIQSI